MNDEGGQWADDARRLFLSALAGALRAADPARAVLRAVQEEPVAGRARVVAVGKASLGMMRGFLAAKRRGVVEAVAVAPPGGGSAGLRGVRVLRADHPLPTRRNVAAARAVAAVARRCRAGETLVALVSGGGSAHLTLPAPGLTLADLRAATGALLRAGASIEELNTVRRHCERLKGGGLARLVDARASVRTLVLSDVIGDRLGSIASGPTAACAPAFAEALAVARRYRLARAAPRVVERLRAGAAAERGAARRRVAPAGAPVTHRIVANNAAALRAAAAALRERGVRVARVEAGVRGEAAEFGRRLAGAARALARSGGRRPAAAVFGGETVVTVGRARGVGGRNTEAALAAAAGIEGLGRAVVVTFATDGADGVPLHRGVTPAGAAATGATCAAARALGLSPARALRSHDAHRFFAGAGGLIVTGPTGTNVNDVAIVLVG